ncbi:hypothetical protein ACFWIB_11695 [Streptomyces sp. NPDC127051]|uniref:hypothetical protein n=1 Tax=Streptomyces sp. NPDC127051 TaxID=3347119 RepID=UPI00365D630E
MSENTTERLTPSHGPFDNPVSELHQLHALSGDLVRTFELATGEPVPVEVRVFYRGKAYSYAMPEGRARELFIFGANPYT